MRRKSKIWVGIIFLGLIGSSAVAVPLVVNFNSDKKETSKWNIKLPEAFYETNIADTYTTDITKAKNYVSPLNPNPVTLPELIAANINKTIILDGKSYSISSKEEYNPNIPTGNFYRINSNNFTSNKNSALGYKPYIKEVKPTIDGIKIPNSSGGDPYNNSLWIWNKTDIGNAAGAKTASKKPSIYNIPISSKNPGDVYDNSLWTWTQTKTGNAHQALVSEVKPKIGTTAINSLNGGDAYNAAKWTWAKTKTGNAHKALVSEVKPKIGTSTINSLNGGDAYDAAKWTWAKTKTGNAHQALVSEVKPKIGTSTINSLNGGDAYDATKWTWVKTKTGNAHQAVGSEIKPKIGTSTINQLNGGDAYDATKWTWAKTKTGNAHQALVSEVKPKIGTTTINQLNGGDAYNAAKWTWAKTKTGNAHQALIPEVKPKIGTTTINSLNGGDAYDAAKWTWTKTAEGKAAEETNEVKPQVNGIEIDLPGGTSYDPAKWSWEKTTTGSAAAYGKFIGYSIENMDNLTWTGTGTDAEKISIIKFLAPNLKFIHPFKNTRKVTWYNQAKLDSMNPDNPLAIGVSMAETLLPSDLTSVSIPIIKPGGFGFQQNTQNLIKTDAQWLELFNILSRSRGGTTIWKLGDPVFVPPAAGTKDTYSAKYNDIIVNITKDVDFNDNAPSGVPDGFDDKTKYTSGVKSVITKASQPYEYTATYDGTEIASLTKEIPYAAGTVAPPTGIPTTFDLSTYNAGNSLSPEILEIPDTYTASYGGTSITTQDVNYNGTSPGSKPSGAPTTFDLSTYNAGNALSSEITEVPDTYTASYGGTSITTQDVNYNGTTPGNKPSGAPTTFDLSTYNAGNSLSPEILEIPDTYTASYGGTSITTQDVNYNGTNPGNIPSGAPTTFDLSTYNAGNALFPEITEIPDTYTASYGGTSITIQDVNYNGTNPGNIPSGAPTTFDLSTYNAGNTLSPEIHEVPDTYTPSYAGTPITTLKQDVHYNGTNPGNIPSGVPNHYQSASYKKGSVGSSSAPAKKDTYTPSYNGVAFHTYDKKITFNAPNNLIFDAVNYKYVAGNKGQQEFIPSKVPIPTISSIKVGDIITIDNKNYSKKIYYSWMNNNKVITLPIKAYKKGPNYVANIKDSDNYREEVLPDKVVLKNIKKGTKITIDNKTYTYN